MNAELSPDVQAEERALRIAMIHARAYARGTASHLSAEHVAMLLPLGYQLRERVVELEAQVKEVTQRNALNASSAAEFAERMDHARARVELLTAALTGMVDEFAGAGFNVSARREAAAERARAVLAAGSGAP